MRQNDIEKVQAAMTSAALEVVSASFGESLADGPRPGWEPPGPEWWRWFEENVQHKLKDVQCHSPLRIISGSGSQ